eukprot:6183684-Pleurochrysis_carterae.AAC.3
MEVESTTKVAAVSYAEEVARAGAIVSDGGSLDGALQTLLPLEKTARLVRASDLCAILVSTSAWWRSCILVRSEKLLRHDDLVHWCHLRMAQPSSETVQILSAVWLPRQAVTFACLLRTECPLVGKTACCACVHLTCHLASRSLIPPWNVRTCLSAQSADVGGTTELVVAMVQLCYKAKNWQASMPFALAVLSLVLQYRRLDCWRNLLVDRVCTCGVQYRGERVFRPFVRFRKRVPNPTLGKIAKLERTCFALFLTRFGLRLASQALNDTIVLLSKRRAQLKQAVTAMVQEASKYVSEQSDEALKLQLIETLRAVSEGKMYVEVERARLTKTLAAMHEAKGELEEARKIMQDTTVETLGGMDRREKTEFILEQVAHSTETNQK